MERSNEKVLDQMDGRNSKNYYERYALLADGYKSDSIPFNLKSTMCC
jgi:hypothetical protein